MVEAAGLELVDGRNDGPDAFDGSSLVVVTINEGVADSRADFLRDIAG